MEIFAKSVAAICARSPVALRETGRQLRWVVIANPSAGGFVMRSRWKKSRRDLEKSMAEALANPLREGAAPAETAAKLCADPSLASCGLMLTEGPGSGTTIANALVDELAANTAPFYLVITAGGDGTSLEVLSVLFNAPEPVRSNLAILRLPMGTGNDGADSHSLAGALELLIKPSRIELMPALRLLTAPGGPAELSLPGRGPLLAFNILSAGLDACVTHMTNKMKGNLPGDFYKLWVDIAALLYDRLYTIDFLDVKALDGQGRETLLFREKLLLLAMGISGHRTYGSQKKILPDSRNVCAIKQMPLLRKIDLKGDFSTGAHITKPEAITFSAHRVEFTARYPMLAQMDGETILLQREDFPAAIELTDPVIPILKIHC
jgi:diacylglycerol kinase family enzyme